MTKPQAFLSTHRTPPLECPVCHRILDAATAVSTDPADPHPRMKVDDVTRCAYCLSVLRMTTLGFRTMTESELTDALTPELRGIVDRVIVPGLLDRLLRETKAQ